MSELYTTCCKVCGRLISPGSDHCDACADKVERASRPDDANSLPAPFSEKLILAGWSYLLGTLFISALCAFISLLISLVTKRHEWFPHSMGTASIAFALTGGGTFLLARLLRIQYRCYRKRIKEYLADDEAYDNAFAGQWKATSIDEQENASPDSDDSNPGST